MATSKHDLQLPHHPGVRVVFGTMTFCGQVDEEAAKEHMKQFFAFHPEGHYVELDTAYFYGETKTEKLLGEILTTDQRSRLRIATKANPQGTKLGLSKDGIIAQLSVSLKNLKMKSVDIFYLHWPDYKHGIKETLEACNELYKAGKFRELGLSNYNVEQIEEIFNLCEENGWLKPTVYQGMYNLLTRSVEEVFPLLRKHGMRFYAFNNLAGGFLTGKYDSVTATSTISGTRFDGSNDIGRRYQDRYWKPEFFQALDLIKKAIAEHCPDRTLTDISLSWLHHNSLLKPELMDGIIIGQSNLEHLKTNLTFGLSESSVIPQGVIQAIEEAKVLVHPVCPLYYRKQ